MARYLVIDWDHQQVQVLAASVKHGVVQVHRALAWAEESSPNPAEAESLGRRLQERLRSAGIAPAPVLVAVGRDRVVLKEIRHPPVPAADEPAVVRFQAIKELSDAPEEVVIDYVASRETASGPERRALVLVLRKELLQTYQSLCKAAGLKLAGITPRPFGTAACLAHAIQAARVPAPEPADAAAAVLTVSGRWAEFCVVQGGQLLLARALPLPATVGEAGLLGEIRRNLAVFAGQSQQSVRALYVASGEDAAPLRQKLHETLAIPVYSLDPLGELLAEIPAERRGVFAGAAGLLHALARHKALPINFVQPRQPTTSRDPNQVKLAAGIGVAALVLLGLALAGYGQVAARDSKLQELTLEKTELDRQLVPLEDDVRRMKAIMDWVNTEVVWLDELYDLTDRFPDPNTMRLANLSGTSPNPGPRGGTTSQLSLKLVTDDQRVVDQLATRMTDEGYYKVHAKRVSRNSTIDRFRFSQQVETAVDIQRRPPTKYVRRLPPAAPRRNPRGGDFNDILGGFMGGQP